MNSEHIQFETNGVTVLVVTVPDDAVEYSIDCNIWHGRLCYFTTQWDWVTIPKGDWSIYAVTTEMSNQDHEQFLRMLGLLRSSLYSSVFKSHQDYSEDMLQSHGIDPKQKNVLLIRKA